MYQDNMGIGGGLSGLIAVLVVLFLFGGGNAFGGNANNNNQNTIELLKGQQNILNQGNSNAMAALVNANANNIAQLQASHANEISQLGGFANLANAIAQQTSTMQLMGANLGAQQQQCCCETQKELIQLAGENKLATCNQTNEIENNITNNSNLIRSDLQQLSYNINQSTSAIINATNAGVQRIIDFETSAKIQDLQQKLSEAKGEISQSQQTLVITNQLNAIAAAIAKIPVTATTGA